MEEDLNLHMFYSTHQKTLHQSVEQIIICVSEFLQVCWVGRILTLTIWTDIGVQLLSFFLGYTNTIIMKPVLAAITPNIKPDRSKSIYKVSKIRTLDLQWLKNRWLVNHGNFKFVLESLEKIPIDADLG